MKFEIDKEKNPVLLHDWLRRSLTPLTVLTCPKVSRPTWLPGDFTSSRVCFQEQFGCGSRCWMRLWIETWRLTDTRAAHFSTISGKFLHDFPDFSTLDVEHCYSKWASALMWQISPRPNVIKQISVFVSFLRFCWLLSYLHCRCFGQVKFNPRNTKQLLIVFNCKDGFLLFHVWNI